MQARAPEVDTEKRLRSGEGPAHGLALEVDVDDVRVCDEHRLVVLVLQVVQHPVAGVPPALQPRQHHALLHQAAAHACGRHISDQTANRAECCTCVYLALPNVAQFGGRYLPSRISLHMHMHNRSLPGQLFL